MHNLRLNFYHYFQAITDNRLPQKIIVIEFSIILQFAKKNVKKLLKKTDWFLSLLFLFVCKHCFIQYTNKIFSFDIFFSGRKTPYPPTPTQIM